MAKLVVRPTTVFARIGYFTCFGLWLGAAVMWYGQDRSRESAVLLVPVLLFLWPVILHMRQYFTTLTVQDGKLSYESGIFSRVTRTMELSRVVDVRVEQSVLQRLFGFGDLRLQPEGEAERIEMKHVDNPRKVAAELLDEIRASRGSDTARG